MVKAEYLGIDSKPLQSGVVYTISTRCVGGKLVVFVKNTSRSYMNLEQFLKEWKVRAVYRG